MNEMLWLRETKREPSRGSRYGGIFDRRFSRIRCAIRATDAVVLAAMIVPGCVNRHAIRPVSPVPVYRYPGSDAPRRLALVSLLGDPYGAAFAQGLPARGGAGTNDRFLRPSAAAVAPNGDVYVLDRGRGVLFRMRYGETGELTGTLRIDAGGKPFPSAVDLVVDRDGTAWVVDSRLAAVFAFDAEGRPLAATREGFTRPVGIARHPSRPVLYVTDIAAGRVAELATDGTIAATHDGGADTPLEAPSYIDVGPDGSIYIVEALSSRVVVYYPDWSRSGSFGGPGDGPGYFSRPKGIAVDAQNLVYVADGLFDNVQVFNRDGELMLALGTTGGGPGRFWQPAGVSIDPRGRLMIADSYNERVQVFEWRSN